MAFVHLHVHTQYSILDGAANIKKLFDKASDDNQIALSITDHGNMFGVMEFLNTANKYPDVKPIVGCEMYVAKNTRFDKRGKEDQGSYHLVLLAKNYNGYRNLVKLSSYAFIEGFYSKPRVDRELLERYGSDLICSSACLGGEIPQAILAGDMERAIEAASWYKSRFGDDFYLELQRHETDAPGADTSTYAEQCRANKGLLEIAEKLKIKCIATNDVHFISADDREAHDRLICLTTNADVDDPDRLRYTKQEYLKTQEEMAIIFADIPDILENTIEIAEKIERYSIESKPIMPYFPIPDSFSDSDDYLRELTYQGALSRYGALTEEHIERIDFELATIKFMGYPDYFLIVQDFIAAARSMGVSVGPGRGSAAGSVVAYSLRITDIDPLKYDLLFERFLNPDRISLPDIDIDFDDDGRSRVLKYVEEKYGEDHVSHVVTFGTMAAKSAIRDVARIQRLPLPESDRLAKLVPARFPTDDKGDSVDVTIDNCIKFVPEFADAYHNGEPLVRETLEYARKLEGTVRNVGVHACAIIIGRDDLREYIPITTANDKETGEKIWVSQYDGSQIEKVGMLKMDFLGLRTLSIIKDAVANIRKSKGIEVDIDLIPIDDAATYDLFSRGDTVGTFQFESDGMRKWLRELKPNRFEDLIAMNALYRPGPMEYIPDFINRKHGVKKIEYDLPAMEEVLSSTYGVTVYQEQVMLLCQKLGGLKKGDADTIRKSMGKKDKAGMDTLKQHFIKGGEENGHPSDVLEKVWRDWEAFAQYAFNKSHSTCYAWIGYQTAYLKANYPSEFMAATLSRNLNDIEELTKLMDECKRMKIEVLGPDVNESIDTFTVNKRGNIRFGMAGIKGVGSAAVDNIVKAREAGEAPFSSVFDFIERINLGVVNRKTIESLIYAGAFDNFEPVKRSQYLGTTSKDELFIDALIRYGNRIHTDTVNGGNSLFGTSESVKLVAPEIPAYVECDNNELLKREKELVGMYLSAHPLDQFLFEVKNFTNCTLSGAADLVAKAPKDQTIQGREIIIAGIVTTVKVSYTRSNGKPFANFVVEDFNGSQNFTLYGKDYEAFMQYMQPNLPLILKCSISPRFGYSSAAKDETKPVDYELKVKKIRHLANTKEDFIKELTVNIPVKMVTKGFRTEMRDVLKRNKGKTTLTIKFLDYENKLAVEFFSAKYQISLNNELLEYFESRSVELSFVPSLSF
ncbi:MAG: DNA polymerase III subunit alpha [Bacteroidales bacterium]|nr:DNA polymerase III subunit alpha [Bacteroidales bacterium]